MKVCSIYIYFHDYISETKSIHWIFKLLFFLSFFSFLCDICDFKIRRFHFLMYSKADMNVKKMKISEKKIVCFANFLAQSEFFFFY